MSELVLVFTHFPDREQALRALHTEEGDAPPPIYAAPCCGALPVYADWVRDRVMDSESASGVRPSQALNFYDTNPPSSIPPEE